MRTSRAAEVIDRAALGVLRRQLQSLPEELREGARAHYLMSQDSKQRDLQDFQMAMIGRIEKLLRQRLDEVGLDFRKFRIGGECLRRAPRSSHCARCCRL